MQRFAVLALLTLILGVFIYFSAQQEDVQATGPNIIQIVADDLGYGELGSYGQTLIQTPNLDQLASEGMLFTQHYAGSPLCNPSRYALMVGQHAGTSGITTNVANNLPANAYGLGRMLQQAGYRTAMIGKWALGVSSSSGYPLKQGFDYFYGYQHQDAAHNYYPETLMENRRRRRLEGNEDSDLKYIAAERHTYAPDVINQKAIDFIQSNHSRAFYLQLHYNLPHVNNEKLRATGNGAEHPGPGRYADRDWSEPDKGYAEMVSLIDDYVGDIVNTLRELGIENNTLVMFTSDNGPTGERTVDSLNKFHATGGLKGMKGMLFEGGIRVPLIAWWPGQVEAGSVSDHVSTFWDMLPTYAELAGLPPPSNTDGLSFAAELTGSGEQKEHAFLYWAIRDRIAVRQGDWKWVRHPTKRAKGDWLYNLSQDPGERKNLSGEQPEKLQQLMDIARRYNRNSEL